MSNRKKLKDARRRLKDPERAKVAQRALAKVMRPSETPLARAMSSDGVVVTDEAMESMGITMPEDEVQVIKEVPAMVTHPQTGEKVEVGTAYIHDDGTVGVRYHEDAPEWALDYVKSTAQEVGYDLGPLFKED